MGPNDERSGRGFGAYRIWAQKDAHARAYETLYEEASVQISRNLYPEPNEYIAPHRDQTCLVCHSVNVHGPNSGDSRRLVQNHRFDVADGVGCESCHGPAEIWIQAHTMKSWHDRSPADQEKTGYRRLSDPFIRARTCAECHVGSAERDVNHDLIAAGHPRLDFEFSAYHANLNKHWDESADQAQIRGQRPYETEMWLAGQIEGGIAAAKLLQARAQSTAGGWPEFAEYSCFACHHNLTQQTERKGRSNGRYPWGSWHFSGLSAIDTVFKSGLAASDSAYAALREVMANPYPDRDAAVKHGESLQSSLEDFRKTHRETPVTSQMLIDAVVENSPTPLSWDRAAQDYLALTALHIGRLERRPDAQNAVEPLLKIRQQLAFPRGYNSPLRYDALNEALRTEFRRVQTESARQ